METKDTRWIVELEDDAETGDLVMPIPPELLAELGWQIGDTLTWEPAEDVSSFKLTKKQDV